MADLTTSADVDAFLGAADNAAARTSLGLGTAAVQPVAAFLATASNLSDLPSKPTARSNLAFGTPSPEAADRALVAADNGATLIGTGTRIFTVPNGLPTGFGVAIKGKCSFAGAAVVTDLRDAGAGADWCALVQTAANAYDVLGGVV